MWATEAGSAAEVLTLGGGHRGHSGHSGRTEAGAEMMMVMMVMMSSPCDNLPLSPPEHKQNLKINMFINAFCNEVLIVKISNLNRLNFSKLGFWLIRVTLYFMC